MRNLKFIGTGCKFTAIPKTAGSFHSHNIHSTSNNTDKPAGNVVNTFKTHIVIGYKLANIICLRLRVLPLTIIYNFFAGYRMDTGYWMLDTGYLIADT